MLLARESLILSWGAYGGAEASHSLSSTKVDETRSELLETFPALFGEYRLRGALALVFLAKVETWFSSVCVEDRKKSTTRCGILASRSQSNPRGVRRQIAGKVLCANAGRREPCHAVSFWGRRLVFAKSRVPSHAQLRRFVGSEVGLAGRCRVWLEVCAAGLFFGGAML
jgi:hypothetical protein